MIICAECFRNGAESAATWYVWPDAHPTGYDYLCDKHVAEALAVGLNVNVPGGLQRSPVYQITRIDGNAPTYILHHSKSMSYDTSEGKVYDKNSANYLNRETRKGRPSVQS